MEKSMVSSRIWTAIAIVWTFCAGGCSSVEAVQEAKISEQGGFRNPEERLAPGEDGGYCSAEVLRWQYDEPSATLRLADARLMLDCCGKRAIHVERIDSLYEVTERDEPDDAEGRCSDQCAFDLSVGVQDVPRGEIYVKLLRDVVDRQGSPAVVWSGTLDLEVAAGAVVLDDAPADAGCQEQSSPRPRSTTVAAR
ncbi:hypothetical protein WME98_28340 [Sorangium sp. So ce296]|uniref:hypothetical protein n=1 Tax=unclassified Sorangium TaxID=2621164 RepID=UPI003F5C0EF4